MKRVLVVSALFHHIPLSGRNAASLLQLSRELKLALSEEDMLVVQSYFREKGRDPTDVELEVIAQTWSEHCKHRIFAARIEHSVDGRTEIVDGLFKSCIRATSERIMAQKPGFVLSAFDDNAGFIRLDETKAVCLKVETHNHPSAIEPYAGANTGLGGVIRDILGAGKGAKPIASLDVFCFGSPDTQSAEIKASEVIHPLGILRGVVRGVRDYGNRIGIPTVCGALQFDSTFIYNPLVFCGTAGIIPIKDIAKTMRPGLLLVAVGGRTGRDGLKGATFSSLSLTTESHDEDQSAVQIGNPIEEKKVSDLILHARNDELIEFVTDCGAGGFSSAAGEMLSEVGGTLVLDHLPVKEEGLASWQILLSESQERMVLAIDEKNLPRLRELAAMYETELATLGHADGSRRLIVLHHGEIVCDLDCWRLHEAPRHHLKSSWHRGPTPAGTVSVRSGRSARQGDSFDHAPPVLNPGHTLRLLLADFTICSREPVIREYDHQVQGNTLLTPLGGATGDSPQDGAVLRVDESSHLVAISCALLPAWGKIDPLRMGLAVVDECVRQLIAMGADPDKIAILDNFCLGNPAEIDQLGALVECVKGICQAAEAYGAPFISGKDSFYNYFQTEEGPASIPVTVLVTGLGILEERAHIIGASLRRQDSALVLFGQTEPESLGGSVFARITGAVDSPVPEADVVRSAVLYRAYYEALREGLILSCHDVGEGGLAVALAEMAFSLKAGLEIHTSTHLFAETPGRLLAEVSSSKVQALANLMQVHGLAHAVQIIGHACANHSRLRITQDALVVDEDIAELKNIWKSTLAKYY
ncbi:MAG: phosphoribosylformylglycinamidine synthase subunit PurL [Verrucomicrobiales bacterium]